MTITNAMPASQAPSPSARRMRSTSVGASSPPCLPMTSAAAPDTCGAAMLVPAIQPQPVMVELSTRSNAQQGAPMPCTTQFSLPG